MVEGLRASSGTGVALPCNDTNRRRVIFTPVGLLEGHREDRADGGIARISGMDEIRHHPVTTRVVCRVVVTRRKECIGIDVQNDIRHTRWVRGSLRRGREDAAEDESEE